MRLAPFHESFVTLLSQAVISRLETENGMLYIPTFYEGLRAVQKRHIYRPGSDPANLAGLDWIAKEKKAQNFYLIGSDTFGPTSQLSSKQDRQEAHMRMCCTGTVVGEGILCARHHAIRIADQQDQEKRKKPDVILPSSRRQQCSFYKQVKRKAYFSKADSYHDSPWTRMKRWE